MKRTFAFLFSLVLTINAFAQDNYYVNGDTGNDDTGTGASGAPWKTLAKVISTVDDLTNDTVHLAGTFREGVTSDFRDKGDNITIQQWEGQTPAWIRGDTVVTGWSAGTGTRSYTKNIGAGLGNGAIVAVVVNWDSQINAYGQHYGHLNKILSSTNGTGDATDQTTVNTVGVGDNSFAYNNTTGVLQIRLGTGATSEDPSSYTISYVKTGLNGIAAGTTTATPVKFTWKNLTFALWCSPTAGTGYGIKVDTTRNALGDGNVYYDCGYHSSGFTNNNGVAMRNNWEKNSSTFGITAAGDSPYVCYADTGGIDGESGFENCYVRLSPYLGRDGNPIAQGQVTSATVIGIVCHTGGNDNIKKFVAKDCLVSVGTTHSTMTNRMASYRIADTAAPGNENDWRTYGAILLRCDTTTGVSALFKGSAAWVYSTIDLSQAGTSGAARITNGGVLGDNAGIDIDSPMLWYGCDIRVNLDISSVAAEHSAIFQCRGNTSTAKKTTLRFIGCSVVNTSMSTAAQVRAFFNQITTVSSAIYARQTIFEHRLSASGANHNNLTYNNSAVTPALIDFKNCWYINVDTDRYTSGTTYNDKTNEFDTAIDPRGIYGTRSPFRDNSGASKLELNAFGKSYRKYISPNIIEGINRRQYGGSHHYGAYQYGKEAAVVPPL